MTDQTAAVEVWARMLCAADAHVYGEHPTWQELSDGRRAEYRTAARWLLPRLTVTAKPAATSAPTEQPVDQTERRDRYAAAMAKRDGHPWPTEFQDDERDYRRRADAVMAVADAEQAELRRERDLAIAHDRQPYPTAWAYEQACKVLHRKTEAIERVVSFLDRDQDGLCCSHVTGQIRALLNVTTPAAAPAVDRAALRETVAAALYRHEWPHKQIWEQALAMDRETFLAQADAVLAVLPPPVSRAAVLRGAADIAESLRQFAPATGARKSAQVSENVGILRVAAELRRLGDETPDTEARCTCADAGACFAPADHYADCPAAGARQDGAGS